MRADSEAYSLLPDVRLVPSGKPLAIAIRSALSHSTVYLPTRRARPSSDLPHLSAALTVGPIWNGNAWLIK